jgi:hypothetical protein
VFGDGPAALPWQVREQPEQERSDAAAGLDPGEPPAIRSRSLSVSALHRSGSTLCHVRDRHAGKITIYGWSIGR